MKCMKIHIYRVAGEPTMIVFEGLGDGLGSSPAVVVGATAGDGKSGGPMETITLDGAIVVDSIEQKVRP